MVASKTQREARKAQRLADPEVLEKKRRFEESGSLDSVLGPPATAASSRPDILPGADVPFKQPPATKPTPLEPAPAKPASAVPVAVKPAPAVPVAVKPAPAQPPSAPAVPTPTEPTAAKTSSAKPPPAKLALAEPTPPKPTLAKAQKSPARLPPAKPAPAEPTPPQPTAVKTSPAKPPPAKPALAEPTPPKPTLAKALPVKPPPASPTPEAKGAATVWAADPPPPADTPSWEVKTWFDMNFGRSRSSDVSTACVVDLLGVDHLYKAAFFSFKDRVNGTGEFEEGLDNITVTTRKTKSERQTLIIVSGQLSRVQWACRCIANCLRKDLNKSALPKGCTPEVWLFQQENNFRVAGLAEAADAVHQRQSDAKRKKGKGKGSSKDLAR